MIVTRDKVRRATRNDFTILLARMENRARDAGCVLAGYGSTARYGDGRDLDVFAVPFRPADYGHLLDAFKAAGYGDGDLYFGSMGTCAVLLRAPNDGPIIDLCIREVKLTESVRDALRKLDVAGHE